MIERFEREYISYHQISPERGRQQLALLRAFDASTPGGILEARGADLQGLAGRWMSEGLHVNTVRKRLNMIRPFFSWAYAVGILPADRYMELKSVSNPRGSSGLGKPRPYSRKELTLFWAQLASAYPLLPDEGVGSKALARWIQGKGHFRRVRKHAMRLQLEAMVRLALDGGLRRAEIYTLTPDHLHYENAYITVVGKADPNTGEPKVRSVPFTGAARDATEAWLELRALIRCEHDSTWLSLWGEAWNQPMQESRFNHLPATVGQGWTWHRFRHTAGTEWLRAGAELETVSRLLGHSTPGQTLGYAEIVKGDIARSLGRVEDTFSRAVGPRAA